MTTWLFHLISKKVFLISLLQISGSTLRQDSVKVTDSTTDNYSYIMTIRMFSPWLVDRCSLLSLKYLFCFKINTCYIYIIIVYLWKTTLTPVKKIENRTFMYPSFHSALWTNVSQPPLNSFDQCPPAPIQLFVPMFLNSHLTLLINVFSPHSMFLTNVSPLPFNISYQCLLAPIQLFWLMSSVPIHILTNVSHLPFNSLTNGLQLPFNALVQCLKALQCLWALLTNVSQPLFNSLE